MNILEEFEFHKSKIENWKSRTGQKWKHKQEVLFELAFCLCTPQSPANRCREAVAELRKAGLLKEGKAGRIARVLRTKARFHNKKANYIVNARKKLDDIFLQIKKSYGAPHALRDWLVENVKGMGVKEASHFLRNIGLGHNLAILDVHVVRKMAEIGLAEEEDVKKGLSYKKYLEYERRFTELAKKTGLSVLELDCTIWLQGSGSHEIM
jgi:N-glycosylase/DNA lyase